MPKYLLQGCYTAEGLRGVLKEGGSKRRAAVEEAVKALGGRLEAFYFAFGETDVFEVIDLPNNVSMTALSMAISASGMAQAKTTALLTPEEVDEATKKVGTFPYRPPGR